MPTLGAIEKLVFILSLFCYSPPSGLLVRLVAEMGYGEEWVNRAAVNINVS